MFDRLVGVETEYALRFHPFHPDSPRVANAVLFERLVRHVRAKVPLVCALIKEFGWFLANGGAVRLERIPFFAMLPESGLVEGATPECRGPRQLLLYQRAQDVLLSRAAAASGEGDGTVALLKNNRDGSGSCYGSHENYEATVATGPALFFWRLGLALLLPLLVPVLIVSAAIFFLLYGAFLLPILFVCNRLQPARQAPAWWEAAVLRLFCLCVLPITLPAEIFVRLTAFRRQRRRMLAFLISRPILAGSGCVDHNGRFTLSPRLGALGSVCGVAAECSHPIFYFGHVLKAPVGVLLGDVRGYTSLFQRRQRLQLAVGDSNMAQTAEFLKVGTTLLVLDAIEAGELNDAPRPWLPLRAFRAICSDPDLRATVRLTGGRRWTALQIQRYYLEGCRRLVRRSAEPNEEAETILRLWEEALDALEQDPLRMVGKLDWVTKRYLLDQAGADAPGRRKIDLRSHELSREGYYVQLEAAGVAPTLVEPEDVLAAAEVGPRGTPAAARGRLIRTLTEAQTQEVRASWSCVVIAAGARWRVIHLPYRGDDQA